MMAETDTGIVRVWEGSSVGKDNVSAVQHRFLRQVQPLAYTNNGQRLEVAAGDTCMIPFSFKLPQYVPFQDALAEQLLRLPPSLDAGEAIVDSSGRLCMQPLIEYAVRSLATVPALAGPHKAQLQQSHKFLLIPFTEPAPPLEQADFPGEFKPSSTTVLRKRSFASPIGELSVAMDEPDPLRMLNDGGRNCGRAWIKLAFRSSRITRSQACLEHWECTLESQIRVKTYYSSMPLYEMASTRLLRANRHLHVRSEFIDLGQRKANLYFRHAAQEPHDNLQSFVHSTYLSKLLLPIDVADNLLPTFCCFLAARRYTLKVCLRIKGLSHQPLVVEAPLQVCYCNGTENQMQFENGSCSTAPPKLIGSSILDQDGTSEALPRYGL